MIDSCYKITVEQFCDCLFEKQYDDITQEAWNKIYVEYCDLMSDASYNESFNTVKEIQELNAKIELAAAILDYFKCVRDPELEKMLRSIGIIPNESYAKTEKSVIARIKKWAAEVQMLQQNLDKTMSNSKKAGRDSFEDSLLAFGQQHKVYYSSRQVTMYQFCKMYKEFEKEAIKNSVNARN